MKRKHPIYVTEPSMPPMSEFLPYLEQIWESRILTNCGPFHVRLEMALCEYLGVNHLSLFSNATLALITALQALRISGEVITTPYSFVATAHSLLWNGITPVFVDIEPGSLNLDPQKIEAAITPRTTAIMPVHCYGQPAKVDEIQRIADNYNLKVIYDAAHAFGVKHADKSLLMYGDLSILSFHATKVFNTFEGGAIISPDAKTKQRIDQLKNFGIVDEITVAAPGINGKMSELNSAFGLVQLGHIDEALERRRQIGIRYRELLATVPGIRCVHDVSTTQNNSYFPIMVEREFPISRDDLYHRLKSNGVHARRYFYPLISSFPMYRGLLSAQEHNLPVANEAAARILCLPIFPTLTIADQSLIVDIIRSI